MPDVDKLACARALIARGDFSEALAALNVVIRSAPRASEAWFLRGAVFHRLADLGAARSDLMEATQIDPGQIQSWIALAAVCIDAADIDAAMSACSSARVIAPTNPQVWFSIGVVQEKCGASDDALASYTYALDCDEQHIGAYKNLISLRLRLNAPGAALDCARRYAAVFPFAADAQFSLGEIYLEIGDHANAARAFKRSGFLAPQDARAPLHEGCALAMSERFSEAQAVLDRALRMDPVLVEHYRRRIFRERQNEGVAGLDARALYILRSYDRIEDCDWSGRSHFVSRFEAMIRDASPAPLSEKALGFRALAMGVDPECQLILARSIASRISSKIAVSGAGEATNSSTPESRRIRIGYISADFRMHPVGLMTSRLFAWHDRERYEIYCYALGGDDKSAVRARIESGCDKFHSVDGLSDEDTAKMIVEDAIDILVDLAGYTDQCRPEILARRPASIQVSWLNYVATTGAAWIDYLIADQELIPYSDDVFYSESVIRMPAGQYLCSYALDELTTTPERHAVGLPATGTVLAAMHPGYKIDPEIFACWMRLLKASNDAVLWLLDANPKTNSNLRTAASQHSVDPGRLVFAPRLPHPDHLARLQLADIFLDTVQCNGGTTICDALVAGVPVVTCRGRTFGQRMAASILRAAALDHFVANDLQEYEVLATSLLDSNESLLAARRKISDSRSNALFFRPRDWVNYLESAYDQVWQLYTSGKAPRSIDIAN